MIGIRNARVLTSDGVLEEDLLIENGIVTRVGGEFEASDSLDAEGAWVGPGFVDLHVHFREPGHEWKEDVGSGSMAAASGGFTAVVAMPNTDPAIDAGHRARYLIDRGKKVGLCEVVPAGALTMGRTGESLSHLDELWSAGVRMFTDDGTSVADAGLLRLAMDYVAEKGGVIAQHAEDHGLSRGGHMHEGSVSSRLGMRGLPALAEEVVVARDLALARLSGVHYHVQHASTAGTAELIRKAKVDGLRVTSEVTPHHLFFNHENLLSLDPVFKMYPPLRTAGDMNAMQTAVKDGTIDAIATDHAPHAAFELEVPFEEAPRGVIGLETSAAAVNTVLGLSQSDFFARMSIGPARIGQFGRQGQAIEEGCPANLVIFDPAQAWIVNGFRSKSKNSPFGGIALKGRVVATIFEGRVTHKLERARS
jgi:dihydroorotase